MKGLAVAALLLLGAGVCPGHGGQAQPRLEMVLDETVGVGPGKIRTLDLPLDEPGVRVIVQFDVVQGLTGVRVLLMSIEDAERWFAGRDHRVLAGSGFGFSGSLARTLPEKGEYRLVLDNLGESRAEARVRLRVRLLRNGASALPYRPERWRAQMLVWITAGLFLSILLFGGLRLKRAFEERQYRLRSGYL